MRPVSEAPRVSKSQAGYTDRIWRANLEKKDGPFSATEVWKPPGSLMKTRGGWYIDWQAKAATDCVLSLTKRRVD